MILLVLVLAGACLFGVLASIVINWASGKSPLWNVGFGVVVVLTGAALLLAAVLLLIRMTAGSSAAPP